MRYCRNKNCERVGFLIHPNNSQTKVNCVHEYLHPYPLISVMVVTGWSRLSDWERRAREQENRKTTNCDIWRNSAAKLSRTCVAIRYRLGEGRRPLFALIVWPANVAVMAIPTSDTPHCSGNHLALG